MKSKLSVQPEYAPFLKRFLREGDRLPERALTLLSRLELVKFNGRWGLTERGWERARRLGFLRAEIGGANG